MEAFTTKKHSGRVTVRTDSKKHTANGKLRHHDFYEGLSSIGWRPPFRTQRGWWSNNCATNHLLRSLKQ